MLSDGPVLLLSTSKCKKIFKRNHLRKEISHAWRKEFKTNGDSSLSRVSINQLSEPNIP